MNSMARRRRALMAQDNAEPQWEQLTFPLSGFSAKTNYTTATISGAAITVTNSNNKTDRNVRASLSTTSGYEYKLVCDVTVTAGAGCIACQNSSSTPISGMETGQITTSQSIEMVFQHNTNIAAIALYSSRGMSVNGNVTYANLKLYRRATA